MFNFALVYEINQRLVQPNLFDKLIYQS